MKRTLHYFLMAAAAIMFFTESHAQSWQWGKRGGSSTQSVNNGDWETVIDMATDNHGNTYVLSKVNANGINVDGHAITGVSNIDIMISSFACDGSYRWSKVIGAYDNDQACALRTDTLGGVYITGWLVLWSYTGNIGNDTTIPPTNKSLFLLKYDTAGAYKWFRMPQADTVTVQAFSTTGSLDMDVDEDGNSYTLCLLPAGAYANGAFVANVTGLYVLKYNASGIFIGGIKLDMSVVGGSGLFVNMAHNHKTGRYYFCGALNGGSVTLGPNTVGHRMYVGSFNSQGTFLWEKENTSNGNGGFLSRPVIDDSGYIYMSGESQNGDNFNGYTVVNTVSNLTTALPFVAKIDSNGNNKWCNNASVNGAANSWGIALKNNNEVIISGSYPGKLQWPGATTVPNHIVNQGYDVFITKFNAHTGAVTAVDTLGSSFGNTENTYAITSDKRGNVYIGGEFAADIRIAGDTLYNIGGQTDFFVAKYGCNCAPTIANYTYVVNNHTVNYTYTGPMPVDSLVWHFGDAGSITTTVATTSHSYAGGSFNVCVTAYTPCDSNTYCQQVQVAVGVDQLSMNDVQVSVWPNPMDEDINVEIHNTLSGKSYNASLRDITGREIINAALTDNGPTRIHVQGLAPGVYFVIVMDPASGMKITRKVVKE